MGQWGLFLELFTCSAADNCPFPAFDGTLVISPFLPGHV